MTYRLGTLLGSSVLAVLLGMSCVRVPSAAQDHSATVTTTSSPQEKKDVPPKVSEKDLVPGAKARMDEPLRDPSGKNIVGPAVTLRVLLPEPGEDWRVLVDDIPYRGEGSERRIKLPAKKSYTVMGVEIPNNYTWRYRTRKVEAQPGDTVVVDLRKEDPKNPDHIEVRYVPTPDDMVEAMCQIAEVGPKDVVYDLGCGNGVIVITAVKKYNAKKGVGIDIDPQRVKEARENAEAAGVADRVLIRQGDVLKLKPEDIADATVVMLYMGDDINLRLRPLLKKALKPGSRVVSHRFKMGDWQPDKSKQLSPDPVYSVHLWIIRPEKGSGKEAQQKEAPEKKPLDSSRVSPQPGRNYEFLGLPSWRGGVWPVVGVGHSWSLGKGGG